MGSSGERAIKGGYAPQKPQNVSPCCCICWLRAKSESELQALLLLLQPENGNCGQFPPPLDCILNPQENHIAPNALKDL